MKILKAFAIVFATALVLALSAGVALFVASERRFDRHYELAAEQVALPTDADAVARGAHVAIVRGCTACHGGDLSGRIFIDDPMLGRFVTPNLTAGAGGVGAQLSPADWEHALRHGVAPDGRGLRIMPSLELHGLGDGDLGDLIAYLRSVPPVDQVLPASQPGPLGRALLVFDRAPIIAAEHIDHEAAHPPAPPPGVTSEYGGYLATSCTGCHQSDFTGGPIPGEKGAVAANLTMDEATGLGRRSEAEFVQTLRTGVRPDGRALNPVMPWQLTAQMSDAELGALWLYFRSLPIKPARTP